MRTPTLFTRIASIAIVLSPGLLAFGQTPAPTQSPRPASTAVVTAPAPAANGRTLNDLQDEIRTRLLRPELRRGQVGIKIVSLNTGRVVFEENAEKYFMPASNMKNFTVAAALEKLSPDYRFVTSVFAGAMPDSSGTVRGNLRIFGRGDVSISTSFSDGNYYKGLDDLADRIAAAGVKRVEGSIVADDSYFRGSAIPGSWEWDDLQWYYGAEVSALPLNDNAVDLSVLPGPAGLACSVTLTPTSTIYRVKNLCTTTPAGSPRTLKVEKLLGQNVLEISGTMPVGNGGFKGSVTVTRPAELFAELLKQRLEAKGITVDGRHTVRAVSTVPAFEQVEIAKLESAPLALIAAKTMKPSQNMYTETLLLALGEWARSRTTYPTVSGVSGGSADSSTLGIGEVRSFLTGIGVPPDSVIQYDGSGLSRRNLVTPSAVAQLYTYMAKSRYTQAWRDSLTIGGVDGTLQNRFKGTAAQGNFRGKTGTIDQVSALSGYMTTAGGEQVVVSFIVNGVPRSADRTTMMDDIVVALAKFNGRID